MIQSWSKQVGAEEVVNTVTHALGIALTLAFSPMLLKLAQQNGTSLQVFGLVLFCLSLLAVYTASTIYHYVHHPDRKNQLKKVDHICIYFLIGGTHTPFVLRYLDHSYGYGYLAILWGLILLGCLYKIFMIDRYPRFSLFFYIFLGWMAVFIIPFMYDLMPRACFYWIMIGGISYTLGTVFYAWEKLPFHHGIWHLFVIGGSAGHFVAMVYAYQS